MSSGIARTRTRCPAAEPHCKEALSLMMANPQLRDAMEGSTLLVL
jgi:hypothetical protein